MSADNPQEPVTMEDGSPAWESASSRYYVRREVLEGKKWKIAASDSEFNQWQRIKYYTLDGKPIALAKARCGDCKDIIESLHCGHYVSCRCGKASCDTDRWFPDVHKYIGSAIAL